VRSVQERIRDKMSDIKEFKKRLIEEMLEEYLNGKKIEYTIYKKGSTCWVDKRVTLCYDEKTGEHCLYEDGYNEKGCYKKYLKKKIIVTKVLRNKIIKKINEILNDSYTIHRMKEEVRAQF